MRQRLFFLLLISVGLFLWSCQTTVVKKEVPVAEVEEYIPAKQLPDTAYVEVARENVRKTPNGKVLGELEQDDMVLIKRRVGNWIEFHNRWYDSAYIWAPSLGMDYINLYSPRTYYNIEKRKFKPVAFFRDLFGGSGELIEETPGEKALFFDDLGLGSHEDVVVQVVAGDKIVVKHGVRLFLEENGLRVVRAVVDFYKPINGLKKAVKQCQLPSSPPDEVNEGRVIWVNPPEYPGLRIVLERKEWNSEWFTQIVLEKSRNG